MMTTAFLPLLMFAQEQPSMKVTMITLGVKDPARSIKFYGETLGLAMAGQPGEVTIFQAGGVQIALNHPLGNSARARFPVRSKSSFPRRTALFRPICG